MKNFKTSQSGGFTVIELMAVLAIVSILATTALATYQVYAKRAKVVEGVAVLTGRKAAITAYYAVNRKMPAYLEQLGWDSDKEKGKWSKEREIAGPESEFWDRVGVMSNPSPNKKNSWKTGYINLYIRASNKILKTKTGKRHVMLEAKGLEGGGLDFRCSVNNAELIEMVPATCRNLRPATPNIQKW